MSMNTPTPAKKTAKKAAKKAPAKKLTARQRQAARAAREGGYIDANYDFIPDKDQLSREELAAQYQSAVGIIYSVPELQGIFEQALNENWSPTRMLTSVQNSEWYRTNGESARIAWAQEQIGGADWQQRLSTAQRAVQQRARQLGSTLTPEQASALARRYVYEAWDKSENALLLDQALAGDISFVKDQRGVGRMFGAAGSAADNLRALATANGLQFTDNWYQSAAQAVARGETMIEDWERDIREQAAGYWPIYADKIRGGMNVYDLASPYIMTMAREFELSPEQVTLDDPYIRQALTHMSQDGTPQALNLWDFQKRLRQDPRWENTAKAQNDITGTVGKMMQMFGFMGG